MKCIGGCPGDISLDQVQPEDRPSQLTIQGVSAQVCGACGEVVHGSRRTHRRLAETQRARRARRPSDGAMRRSGWSEKDWGG
jgi:hypothetical protein